MVQQSGSGVPCDLRRTMLAGWYPLAAVVVPVAVAAAHGYAQEQVWLERLGGHLSHHAWALEAREVGGVFIAGQIEQETAAVHDVFLAAYDRTGNQLWFRRFGSAARDRPHALAQDGAGGVYVAGGTRGDLGGPLAGPGDAFLARFNGDGDQLWIRQFGTEGFDEARGLATDGEGGVYLSGATQGALAGAHTGAWDAVLMRFDSDGNLVWGRQLGSSASEAAMDVAPDGAGGVFVGGHTGGNLGGQAHGPIDAWVAHYDPAGNQTWIRQFGRMGTAKGVWSLAPDGSGGVFAAGAADMAVSQPVEWAWVTRFDRHGQQMWLRTDVIDPYDRGSRAYSAAHDGEGGVLLAGTRYPFFLFPEPDDAFIAHHDHDGNQTWIRTFMLSGSVWDEAWAVTVDHLGSAYVAGWSYISSISRMEAFLARYDYREAPCYPNCDGSTTEPILTVDDFTCFVNEFAQAVMLPHEQQIEHYANCEGSTAAPVLTVDDFTCFVNAFAAGCP